MVVIRGKEAGNAELNGGHQAAEQSDDQQLRINLLDHRAAQGEKQPEGMGSLPNDHGGLWKEKARGVPRAW